MIDALEAGDSTRHAGYRFSAPVIVSNPAVADEASRPRPRSRRFEWSVAGGLAAVVAPRSATRWREQL